jgi:hypothetical protein
MRPLTLISSFVVAIAIVQGQEPRPTAIETEAKLTMEGRELKTPDIAQGRELKLYDDGGHFDCRELALSDTAPRNCDLPKARDFIWAHWRERQRGYVRVTVDSVDTMSTSHIFIEPDKQGVWHVSWRIAQARGNSPNVVRDEPEIVAIERTDSKLIFKGRDGSEQKHL